MKPKMMLVLATVLTSIAFGAQAEPGEDAVSESRAGLKEAWGKAPTQPTAAQAVQRSTTFAQDEFNAHIATPRAQWAGNYAAGRKHEPADHDGR